MNNLNLPENFESSPIASPMVSELNGSMSMMGGARKRNRKINKKKGGMDSFTPDTPEKDKGSRVAPLSENVKPNNIVDILEEESTLENAVDSDYADLENQIISEDKVIENESKNIDRDEDKLDRLERGDFDLEARGGSTRRRKRRISRRNKNNKKTKMSKKKRINKKTRKTRKLKNRK
jgi:hypothetical protein